MIATQIVMLIILTFRTEISAPKTFIPIDIEFCDSNKSFEKSICTIRHAETISINKLILHNPENIIDIIIDKRTITPEKGAAIFANGSVVIKNKIVIDLPGLHKTLLIRPGEYSVETTNRGYRIEIR